MLRARTATFLFAFIFGVVGAFGGRASAAPGAPPWVSGLSRAEDLKARLINFGPGNEVYKYFGHVGIEIRDTRLGAAVLYDFGLFSFDSAMIPKFLMGRLLFWSAGRDPRRVIQHYISEDSDVRVADLSLSPEQTLDLARRLADAVTPENRMYLYHHYENNCATRLVDFLDEVTGGQVKPQLQAPDGLTLRDHTRRFTSPHPIMEWLMTFAMNADVDQPTRRLDATFLPEELAEAAREVEITGPGGEKVPLVRNPRIVNRSKTRPPAPSAPRVRWPYTLTLGVLGGVALLLLGRWRGDGASAVRRRAFGLAHGLVGVGFGVLGLLVMLMATFTDHTMTYRNQNLLYVNPLTLVAGMLGLGIAFFGWRQERWLFRLWSVLSVGGLLALAIKILPGARQDNAMVWTLILPITLSAAYSAWRASGSRSSPGS